MLSHLEQNFDIVGNQIYVLEDDNHKPEDLKQGAEYELSFLDSLAPRHKQQRTRASRLDKQEVAILEAEFQKVKRPSTRRKVELAGQLCVSDARINNWFQNRRAKEKLNALLVANGGSPLSTANEGSIVEDNRKEEDDKYEEGEDSWSLSIRSKVEMPIEEQSKDSFSFDHFVAQSPKYTKTTLKQETRKSLTVAPFLANRRSKAPAAIGASFSYWNSMETFQTDQSNTSFIATTLSQDTYSTSSDSSIGFETDFAWSAEETDYEDDDIPHMHDSQPFSGVDPNEALAKAIHSSELSIQPLLSPIKKALFEGIMREFWTIFNQEWSNNIRKRAENPSHSTSSSTPESNWTAGHTSSKKEKRRDRGDDEDAGSEEDSGRNPKRPNTVSSPLNDAVESRKFACPYHKHDPKKYCYRIRRWRTCALSPLDSISRVKGHLFRHHRVFQCPRCKELFRNSDEKEAHFVALAGCQLKLEQAAEGIDSIIEKQLRSRKKTHRDQSDTEKWQEIYKLLFPREEVPSPYFEPVQDDIIHSPDSNELANYEEYSRRELPRFFQNALEAAVAKETQPIEERLKSQLVDMIKDCQDQVLSTYRSGRGSDTTTYQPVWEESSLEHSQSPIAVNRLNEHPSKCSPNSVIEAGYKLAPLQTLPYSHLDATATSIVTKFAACNARSDSGYVSEFSAWASQPSETQHISEFPAIIIDDAQCRPTETSQAIEEPSVATTYSPPIPLQDEVTQPGEAYEFIDMLPSEMKVFDFCPYGLGYDDFYFDNWTSESAAAGNPGS